MSSHCPLDGCICQPLSTARRGESLVVRHLTGEPDDCRRLREMGLRERASISVVCIGGAVIAQVQGAKVCLSRRMAETVFVAGPDHP
jgi:Fe2+ transport system protein FeoA